MTKSLQIKIEMLSYWHIGSGIGRGADVDALVLKDAHGLPLLPGRTVKGLFREGMQSCEDVGQAPSQTTNKLFGAPAEKGRYDGSIPGVLTFDTAVLPDTEQSWLASKEGAEVRAALYERFSSTRLNEFGLAEDHTLRSIELCVPLTLLAKVSGPEEINWSEFLRKAGQMVRVLGSHRNRGLGRCRITLEV